MFAPEPTASQHSFMIFVLFLVQVQVCMRTRILSLEKGWPYRSQQPDWVWTLFNWLPKEVWGIDGWHDVYVCSFNAFLSTRPRPTRVMTFLFFPSTLLNLFFFFVSFLCMLDFASRGVLGFQPRISNPWDLWYIPRLLSYSFWHFHLLPEWRVNMSLWNLLCSLYVYFVYLFLYFSTKKISNLPKIYLCTP